MGGSTHCGFIVTNRSFHPEKHILTGVTTVAGENYLQNLTFGYDDFNNLEARIDNLRNLNESFTYDNLNRLTDIELNGVQTGMMTYDNYGRMTSKTMDGQLVFQGASFDGPEGKPHAIKSAQTNEGVFPADVQKIDYTSFDKVKHIAEGDNKLSYTYGYNRQRIGMEETIGGKQRNKTYVGNCEYVTETADGVTTEKVLTYLSGPTGVFAVVEKQGEEESLHYILKDHLGSWTTITDAEGNVEQELSYDAWGNLRDADTWTGTGTEAPMFDRGYTGHEHITAFGLINMNGRCYDPLMSSFLSVDEYVQDPTSAQNFNRYAYCLNNPLKYTDPSGWYYLGGGHSCTSIQGPYENTWNISERRTIDPSWSMAFLESWNYFWEGEEFKNGGSVGGENTNGEDVAGQPSNDNGAGNGDKPQTTGNGNPGGKRNIIYQWLLGYYYATATNNPIAQAVPFLTGQVRHFYGPDAIAFLGTVDAASGVGLSVETGRLLILRGDDAGTEKLLDMGAGVTLGISHAVGGEVVFLYSSSDEVIKDNFFGPRWELNISPVKIVGVTGTFSYHDATKTDFTIGIGVSASFDFTPFNLGININRGVTANGWRDFSNQFKP